MGVGLTEGTQDGARGVAQRPGQPDDHRFGGVRMGPDVLRALLSSKAKHGQPMSLVCRGLAELFLKLDFHMKFVLSDSP